MAERWIGRCVELRWMNDGSSWHVTGTTDDGWCELKPANDGALTLLSKLTGDGTVWVRKRDLRTHEQETLI